jgi:hypothetical protein
MLERGCSKCVRYLAVFLAAHLLNSTKKGAVLWPTVIGGTIKVGKATRIGGGIKTAMALATMTVTAGATKAVEISVEVVKAGETTGDLTDGVVAAKVHLAATMTGDLGRASGEALAATTIRALDAITAAEALRADSAAMTTHAATMARIKDTARITVGGLVITGNAAEVSVGSGIVRAMRSPPGSAMMMLSAGGAWTNSAAANTVDAARRAIPARTTASARM